MCSSSAQQTYRAWQCLWATGSELEAIRLKEAKSSCGVACDQLASVKRLLHTYNIVLGAVNLGIASGSGGNTLVRSLLRVRRDIDKCIIRSSALWRAVAAVVYCSTTAPASSRSSPLSCTRSQRTLRAEGCDLLCVISLMKCIRICLVKTAISSAKFVRTRTGQIRAAGIRQM